MMQRQTNRTRHGLTLVETTIVLSLVLMLILGIYEYGRFVMARQVVQNAAREGARLAVVSTNTLTETDIQNTVRNYLVGQDLSTANVTVYWADPNTGNNLGVWTNAAFGQGIAVEVDTNYQPILPAFLKMSTTIPLRVKTVMYSEAN